MTTRTVLSCFAPNFTSPNIRLLCLIVRPAMPVPLRATCCGLLGVLSVNVSVAACGPTELGENATASVHDLVGASVTGIGPQVPAAVTANSAESDDIALEMISGFFLPVLRIVRCFVTDWPTATLPKSSESPTAIEVVGVPVGVADAVAVAVGVAV